MFRIINGKGFHITFKNGVTVSVQFGVDNYCGDYPTNLIGSFAILDEKSERQAENGCENAEIAIMGKKGFITQEFERVLKSNVIGYCSPEYVLKALIWAENYKKGDKK